MRFPVLVIRAGNMRELQMFLMCEETKLTAVASGHEKTRLADAERAMFHMMETSGDQTTLTARCVATEPVSK